MWFPLRVHSHYSLLESTLKPKDIVSICKQYDYKTIGLTDFCTIAGIVKFVQECKKNEIKPILGCEIALSDHNNNTSHFYVKIKTLG